MKEDSWEYIKDSAKFRALLRYFYSDAKAFLFLTSPQQFLGGRSPILAIAEGDWDLVIQHLRQAGEGNAT